METFKIHPRLSYKKIGEESLILDTKLHREVHQLNDVATFLWISCEQPKNKIELIKLLTDHFDVDLNEAQEDVTQFLKELTQKDLLLIQTEN